MQHVTDAMIDALVDPAEAQAALADAFRAFGRGEAAVQPRERTEAGGVKLSTLGAVIPGQGVAGAKVYTTIGGRFSFVILLFSAETGAPLASFDAAAITRLRTAACSVLAARALARPDASVLAVLGLGVQGQAHARQFARAFRLQRICVHSPHAGDDQLQALQAGCGVPVQACGTAADAVAQADLVVTATRARAPLFDGTLLRPGTFVAAVGSSLPTTRELDDRALARARVVAVEWRVQTLREAGDLVLADPAVLPPAKVVELSELLLGRVPGRRADDDVTIYKSVGVGLQDVALAGLAWRKLQGASA
ncbi:MAG: ornithine cyclodeaminase family protein [Rubrivivax sp.]